jgi:hypothetical protein
VRLESGARSDGFLIRGRGTLLNTRAGERFVPSQTGLVCESARGWEENL